MNRHIRGGIVLLEVLVAMVLLATAGLGWAALTVGNARAAARARETDDETVRAGRFFAALSYWSGDDLDRHLGEHQEGPFLLYVEHNGTGLYRVRLTDLLLPTRVVLSTALYRRPAPRSHAR